MDLTAASCFNGELGQFLDDCETTPFGHCARSAGVAVFAPPYVCHTFTGTTPALTQESCASSIEAVSSAPVAGFRPLVLIRSGRTIFVALGSTCDRHWLEGFQEHFLQRPSMIDMPSLFLDPSSQRGWMGCHCRLHLEAF